jgi:hypothetical protein
MDHVKALLLHSPTGFIFSGRNHKGVEFCQIGQDGLVLFLQPGKCIHPLSANDLPWFDPGINSDYNSLNLSRSARATASA